MKKEYKLSLRVMDSLVDLMDLCDWHKIVIKVFLMLMRACERFVLKKNVYYFLPSYKPFWNPINYVMNHSYRNYVWNESEKQNIYIHCTFGYEC